MSLFILLNTEVNLILNDHLQLHHREGKDKSVMGALAVRDHEQSGPLINVWWKLRKFSESLATPQVKRPQVYKFGDASRKSSKIVKRQIKRSNVSQQSRVTRKSQSDKSHPLISNHSSLASDREQPSSIKMLVFVGNLTSFEQPRK